MTSFPWKWSLADLPKPTRGRVFSTFACGGGSSMGYKRAGFEVVGCCEIDPKINAVYVRNLHPRHSFVMDLREFNRLDDYPQELKELDILDGSPPCSLFSTQGLREDGWGKAKKFKEGQAMQTLDDLFFVFLETVRRLRPRVVVAENVTGLIKGNAKGYVNEIVKQFKQAGYEVQLFMLNAAFMEVPQRRERVFFVANRCGFGKLDLKFDFKPIMFSEVKVGKGKQVGGDVSAVNSTMRLLDKAKRTDKTLADISARERGKNVGFGQSLVWPDMVCPTFMSSGLPGPYRMPEREIFNIDDIRNVGTFPQDYWFGDGEAEAWNNAHFMVGMSVPPSMTAHIADEIWRQWLGPAAGRGGK